MPSANQPCIPLPATPEMGDPIDDAGNQWMDAAVDADGRVLAGHTRDGRFHAYVPTERLYDHLTKAIMSRPTER